MLAVKAGPVNDALQEAAAKLAKEGRASIPYGKNSTGSPGSRTRALSPEAKERVLGEVEGAAAATTGPGAIAAAMRP